MSAPSWPKPPPSNLRWWPAAGILLLTAAALVWIHARPHPSFQERNLQTLSALVAAVVLLLLWWLTASRAPWKLRLLATGAFALGIAVTLIIFRFHGVSGDLRPVLELRWARHPALRNPSPGRPVPDPTVKSAFDFPQFLGPHRTAILEGPALSRDWHATPPEVLWRQPIGAAWSGWAIVGSRAFTQEQRPEGECVACYDALTGQLLWVHADPVHYQNALAGEGPRCTPTVVSNRVFALGATGLLNCLDAATGKSLWSHDIVADAQSHIPEWGFSGSPLFFHGRVLVSAGGSADRSLLAYDSETGKLAWSAGKRRTSYSSPSLATLCGVRQILGFNSRVITSHDAVTGQVLWEYPWGIGEPQVAVPVVVGTNRVLFTSGYGVGCELLEIATTSDRHLSASRVWKTTKMKAKISSPVQRDGFIYGLDDGVLACLDLKDGSQRWKAGRYGHGQGLLIRDLYLIMAESGELILLHPTPDAPNELHRFRVFTAKTWNPIALSGHLLLARTDREAACLRIATEK